MKSYLRAKTANGLRLAIKKLENSTGQEYRWDIYYAQGYHYAWYRGDVRVNLNLKEIKEEMNETVVKLSLIHI